jgi:hypothetical protein
MTEKTNKVVVFDMDETLGSFVELGMFWDTIISILGEKSEQHFFEIIEIFPLFIRPHILYILKYLLEKKKSMECDKIIIYTNNQGPKSWASLISKYFDYKLNSKTFDQIIGAFKVNGKIIEHCRTTNNKTIHDLHKCTGLPLNTNFCFIDDQYHDYMRDYNVVYLEVKPYNYSLDFSKMAERYYNKFKKDIPIEKYEFIEDIVSNMNKFNYPIKMKTADEQNIDIIVSKKIVEHLEYFFSEKQ